MQTYQHFIDGHYVDPLSGRWMDTVDPYTGQAWARIPQGCEKDVDRAVAAASRALKEGPWHTMTATERGKLMLKLADLVTRDAQRLAEIEVRDNGKLLAEMRGQLNYHPEWWRYFGGLADKVEGRVMPIDKPEMFAFSRQEPVGVVGAITAWNSPLLFIAWKCAPALAAGSSSTAACGSGRSARRANSGIRRSSRTDHFAAAAIAAASKRLPVAPPSRQKERG